MTGSGGKSPSLHGALPGHTGALGVPAYHGFGLVWGTILLLNALCRALAEPKSSVASPALSVPVGILGVSGYLCFGTIPWLSGEAPALVGSVTQLPSLSASEGVGPGLPPQASCPSSQSVSFMEVLLPRRIGCLPTFPLETRKGGKEQANSFHVYNRAQECFCFMATVIAH